MAEATADHEKTGNDHGNITRFVKSFSMPKSIYTREIFNLNEYKKILCLILSITPMIHSVY
jgi:hypothetical protein